MSWIAGLDPLHGGQAQEDISEHCKVRDIVHLDFFAPTWWQVGDKALLRAPAEAYPDDSRPPKQRFDDSHDTVEIRSSRTCLTVRWQDGTLTDRVAHETTVPRTL